VYPPCNPLSQKGGGIIFQYQCGEDYR
jgi:hypothetical protein